MILYYFGKSQNRELPCAAVNLYHFAYELARKIWCVAMLQQNKSIWAALFDKNSTENSMYAGPGDIGEHWTCTEQFKYGTQNKYLQFVIITAGTNLLSEQREPQEQIIKITAHGFDSEEQNALLAMQDDILPTMNVNLCH